jgi:hypothetical protein
MATDTYEVLVPELTLHQVVAELRDKEGNVTGVQQGRGKTFFKGETVPASFVSPVLVDALEDDEHPAHESVSRKLKKSGQPVAVNVAVRFGLPFEGYDDAEEDDIIAAMRVLPSSTVQAIKQYESEHENRERIVFYNIGFGQSPGDREEDLIGGGVQEGNPDKAVSNIQFREVPEEGPVQRGEGITGTGDPQVAYGTAAADDDDSEESNAGPHAKRRSRRRAAPKTESSQENPSPSGSNE